MCGMVHTLAFQEGGTHSWPRPARRAERAVRFPCAAGAGGAEEPPFAVMGASIPAAEQQRYFIAAELVEWDYAPLGLDGCTGAQRIIGWMCRAFWALGLPQASICFWSSLQITS